MKIYKIFLTMLLFFTMSPLAAVESNQIIMISPKEEACGKTISITDYAVKNIILESLTIKFKYDAEPHRGNCMCKGTTQQIKLNLYGNKKKYFSKKLVIGLHDYQDLKININQKFHIEAKLVIYFYCNTH